MDNMKEREDAGQEARERRSFAALKLVALFVGAVAVGILAVVALQYVRIAPAQLEGDYARFFEGSDADLVLYTSATCDVCDDAKAFLGELDVPFEEREIHPFTAWQKDLEELGVHSVPTFLFREEAMVGFRARHARQALKRHGLL